MPGPLFPAPPDPFAAPTDAASTPSPSLAPTRAWAGVSARSKAKAWADLALGGAGGPAPAPPASTTPARTASQSAPGNYGTLGGAGAIPEAP